MTTNSGLDELTEPRSPELLRQPEFSQPLVTALQIAIYDILQGWGVQPQAVIGHSSGEIAAAYAAGLVTKENAIKAAYYRGQASVLRNGQAKASLGMLAAGIGASDAPKYLDGLEDAVQIACYNSPSSLTLSGTVAALDEVKTRLADDGKFARMLQVNLAYHSRFMKEIGDIYKDLLHEDFDCLSPKQREVKMFSSVLGHKMGQAADADYWTANMVSPVRFEEAARELMTHDEGADFLIEIGPSGALAGPIKQIKQSISGGGANIQYCASLSRGQDAINSLFDAAGRLFVAGGKVDLAKVNNDGCSPPQVITDLPNYSWNHSTKYWYENESSKDWRNRLFPHHDLLGSKVLGNSYHAPVWKKTLRVEDLPWLKDHRMGPEIVFPAAAFIAMGVEAMAQVSQALHHLEGKALPKSPRYRVRNSTFPKALVLEEEKPTKIMLSLSARPGSKDTWHEFKVFSLTEDAWAEHCRGLVRIEEDTHKKAPAGALAPLRNPTSGKLWYKAMEDAGYGFGPLFQKHLETESLSGQRTNRSIVDLTEPPSEYTQSYYPLHPASIDGCLQTCSPGLWRGRRTHVNAVVVPAIIDDVVICPKPDDVTTGMSVSSSKYVGLGRREETKNSMSDATIYHPETGALLFQVSGLRFHKLETTESQYAAHKFSRLSWKPDVSFISQDGISSLSTGLPESGDHALSVINEVIDMVAHKSPMLKVAEINMIPGNSSSLWLDGSLTDKAIRAASKAFNYTAVDATGLAGAQEKYNANSDAEFSLLDVAGSPSDVQLAENDFDLALIRLPAQLSSDLSNIAKNSHSLLREGGHVLFLVNKEPDVPDSDVSTAKAELPAILDANGFSNTHHIPFPGSSTLQSAYLTTTGALPLPSSAVKRINLVHLAPASDITTKVKQGLEIYGWEVAEHSFPSAHIQFDSTTLILDDFSSSVLPTMTENQWDEFKDLTTKGSSILWVTEGSQMEVKKPNNAMIHGLTRSIRAEDPSISITTLDVEKATNSSTVPTIDTILKTLQDSAPLTNVESEFVERRGVLYVSRILPDEPVNKVSAEEKNGPDAVDTYLHEEDVTVRLRAERLGTVDSIQYAAVDSKELPLGDNRVEVEVAAAGLNFKDLAVTMGIVPENEYLLGLEGAGTIRRAGSTSYKVGQRVLVFEKGTFANRIIATTERVYPIPDWMSFEEASTLASVYLVSLYSLYDLSNTQKGQRVLIHSASGGLGVACIQICHYIGAEVYATVGSKEKRKFLMDNYGVPDDHIFNSRSTEFAGQILEATNDEGVDVIINSLTGDLLEESWRCIREGGTMVELGKKDMLDRNYLPMEQFGRNASYRCFDMAHVNVSDALIAQLLKQLMPLVEARHLKPIQPITTFPFHDIGAAYRYMRGANHLGKIVISNGSEKEQKVSARPAPHVLKLRDDVSYLIVGGLKGLCGSLAVRLAQFGAKRLVVMSRSGYDDKLSQATIEHVRAEGCEIDLVKGDVSVINDVRRAFREATLPVGGVIQGAMVLRVSALALQLICESD